MLILCDIDGVIADPCEYVKKYLLSTPPNWTEYFMYTGAFPIIPGVVELVRGMLRDGHLVVFHTGRPESNREATRAYMLRYLPELQELVGRLRMRPDGNRSPSAQLKLANCRMYGPALVIEDEPAAVQLLSKAGYTVLQVCGHRFDGSEDRVPD